MSQYFNSGYNKHKYTEEEILDGLKNNNDKVIRYIYKSYMPGIKSMVYGFRSLVLDPEDVFQDGIISAMKAVQNQSFRRESSFKTYFSSICINICKNQLRKSSIIIKDPNDPPETFEKESNQEELITRMIWMKNNMVDEKCRQIIELRFGFATNYPGVSLIQDSESNVRFEEIAKTLNIEANNARKRFQRCLEKLREIVFDDKVWAEILSNAF
jgi:RNA polymerase sigma factor (sigma-70 family)